METLTICAILSLVEKCLPLIIHQVKDMIEKHEAAELAASETQPQDAPPAP